MTSTTYALISDRLVVSAMVAFVLAMLAYAIGSAAASPRISSSRISSRTPLTTAVLVRARTRADTAAPAAPTAPAAPAQSDHHHPAGPPAPPTATATATSKSTSTSTTTSSDEREPASPTLPSTAGTALLVLGLLLTMLGATARGLAAGRTPWSNMYEFTVVGVAAIVTSFLVLSGRPRTRVIRRAGVWVAAAAALCLGLATTVLYTPAAGLIPVLDSIWLVIHVAAAIVAGGLFTVGAVASVLHLIGVRRQRRGLGETRASNLAESFDQAAQTAYTVAFPIWTFAVIAGAIWAENSWGRYWGWDPKETWAFITWVLYAAYLHAQATGGWRGTRASWLALGGYGAFLFNFVGVNIWVGGLHSYAGV